MPTQCGILYPGQGLGPNQVMFSCSGKYVLAMQGDSNLVLYYTGNGPWHAIWFAGTWGKNVHFADLQPDGNFVAYTAAAIYSNGWAQGWSIWSTNPYNGVPYSYLGVQDDGNLVLYKPDGHPNGASNTYGKK